MGSARSLWACRIKTSYLRFPCGKTISVLPTTTRTWARRRFFRFMPTPKCGHLHCLSNGVDATCHRHPVAIASPARPAISAVATQTPVSLEDRDGLDCIGNRSEASTVIGVYGRLRCHPRCGSIATGGVDLKMESCLRLAAWRGNPVVPFPARAARRIFRSALPGGEIEPSDHWKKVADIVRASRNSSDRAPRPRPNRHTELPHAQRFRFWLNSLHRSWWLFL